MEFINGAIAIAPVYYVTGNHESRLPELYAQLREQMESAGVVVLDNKAVTLEYGSSIIRVLGVDDPTFSAESDLYEDERAGDVIPTRRSTGRPVSIYHFVIAPARTV